MHFGLKGLIDHSPSVMVVERHTFLELESLTDENIKNRPRAFTDSCLMCCFIDDDAYSQLSTSAESVCGDASPSSLSSGDSTPSVVNWEDVEEDTVQDMVSPSHLKMSVSDMPPGAWFHAKCPVPQEYAAPKKRDGDKIRHRWPPQARGEPSAPDCRTTLMLRNLPSCFIRQNVLDMLDEAGFAGTYDFVYLPIDFHTGAGLGYAFLNAVDNQQANAIIEGLQGYSSWNDTSSQKILDVCWSAPHQGLDMLVDRYRNSRVMHGSVPDEYKPVLFTNGTRVPFPRHTKRIRAPFLGGSA